MDKTYKFCDVINNIYYDIIDLIGEDGLCAEIDIELLLATIAAPITRLDFDDYQKNPQKKIVLSVRRYMRTHHRWQNLTHEALVRRLMYDWIPTLSQQNMREFVENEFRMIDAFTSDGITIINEKVYKLYCEKRQKLISDGNLISIQYGAMSDVQGVSRGMRWPESKYDVTREYYGEDNGEGVWIVNHDVTEDEWYRLLKEKTSGKMRNVLMAYLDLDKHRASPWNIEQWYGIDKFSVNACNTALGRRAKIRMNIEVHDTEGVSRCWSMAMNNGKSDKENGFVWEMRPELVRAVERISKEDDWSPVKRIG